MFISTLYVLIIVGSPERQSHFESIVISKITALLPANGAIVEYEIYIAIVPLIVFWIVVLRLTHMSREEKDIEYFKRNKGERNLRRSRL